MYVARSLCTLKSLNKVKATFWGAKLLIDGDEFKPQSDWYQPWDMMTFNASTWVRVCGPNSDKAFRLMTGVWRRQEIKTSGAQLNKKSVRKRPFDIKCQILSEELEMTSVEEIRNAQRMLTCNNPEALEQKCFPYQCFVGLLTTSLQACRGSS